MKQKPCEPVKVVTQYLDRKWEVQHKELNIVGVFEDKSLDSLGMGWALLIQSSESADRAAVGNSEFVDYYWKFWLALAMEHFKPTSDEFMQRFQMAKKAQDALNAKTADGKDQSDVRKEEVISKAVSTAQSTSMNNRMMRRARAEFVAPITRSLRQHEAIVKSIEKDIKFAYTPWVDESECGTESPDPETTQPAI